YRVLMTVWPGHPLRGADPERPVVELLGFTDVFVDLDVGHRRGLQPHRDPVDDPRADRHARYRAGPALARLQRPATIDHLVDVAGEFTGGGHGLHGGLRFVCR